MTSYSYASLFLKLKREGIYLPRIFCFFLFLCESLHTMSRDSEFGGCEGEGQSKAFLKQGGVTLSSSAKKALLWGWSVPPSAAREVLASWRGNWCQGFRAGGWKKRLTKPLLHHPIGMEGYLPSFIVPAPLGVLTTQERMEGRCGLWGEGFQSQLSLSQPCGRFTQNEDNNDMRTECV